MASSIDIDFGLNANDFLAGVSSVGKQTKSMANSVERQIQTLAKEYQALKGNSSEYERYKASLKNATAEQRSRINALVDGIEAEKRHKQAMQESADQADKLRGKYQNIAGTLKQLAVGYFSVAGAQKAIGSMDAYDQVQNKLRRVTDGEAELQAATAQTKKIALESRTSWDSVAAIYQKVGINADKLGLSQEQVGTTAETISKAMKVSGASAQSTSAALYQLGQAFDKGVLNGDEFASISENTGYVMDALAKQLGVTRGELKEMSSQGQLTSDIMIKAFAGMGESVDADFAKVKVSFSDAMENLKTESLAFMGNMNQSYNITGKLVSGLNFLSHNLDAVAAVMMGTFAAAAVYAGKSVYGTITAIKLKTVELLNNRQATIALTAKTLRNAQATNFQATAEYNMTRAAAAGKMGRTAQIAAESALSGARSRAIVATNALKVAENAAAVATSRLAMAKTLLLGAMGGPVGLIVTGASVAAMYYALSDATDDATNKTDKFATSVADAAQKMREMNEAQKAKFQFEAMQELVKLSKELDEMVENIAKFNGAKFDSIEGVNFLKKDAEAIEQDAKKIAQGFMTADEAVKKWKANNSLNEQQQGAIAKTFVDVELKYSEKSKAGDIYQGIKNGFKTDLVVDAKMGKNGVQDTIDSLNIKQKATFDSIKTASDEFQEAFKQFGMTKEELKLLEMQTARNKLAEEKAEQSVLDLADAQIAAARDAWYGTEASKERAEADKKQKQLTEENAKFVAGEIEERTKLIYQLGMTKNEISAFNLAAKGATDTQLKQVKAMDKVISEYEKQNGVMKTLEGYQKEVARLGLSDTESKLLDLKEAGANEQQLSLAKMQLGAIEEFKLSTQAQKNASNSFNKSATLTNTMAEKFANGVDGFVGGVDKLKEGDKAKKSPLALDNPQIGLIKGKGWYNDHIDKDPTGRGIASKGSQQVMADMLKKAKADVNAMGKNFGTLYIASQDGKTKAEVQATPENIKLIEQIAMNKINQMVRDGAMGNS